MISVVSPVRSDTLCAELAISRVAWFCCSTDELISWAMPLISPMMSLMLRMASADLLGGALDGADLGADLLGRLGGLAGQRFHLARHHGKALAGFTGPRRLDGRVQRQQIGLAGDIVDEVDDIADLLRGGGQFGNRGRGEGRLFDGAGGDLGRAMRLALDFRDRGGEFFRRGSNRLGVAGGGARGIRRLCRLCGVVAGDHGHAVGKARGLAGAGGDFIDHRLHGTLEFGGDAGQHVALLGLGARLGFAFLEARRVRPAGARLPLRPAPGHRCSRALREVLRGPDQHAGLDEHDHRMQHDAEEIATARKDRFRQR